MQRRRSSRGSARAGSASALRKRVRELEQAVDGLRSEAREALDRQAATAEILTVMSRSTVDVQPVFDAIVRNVQRLFGTRFAVLQLVRDGQLVLVAFDGHPGFERITGEFPRPVSGDSMAAKAIRTRGTVQLAPIVDNPAAPERSRRMARTLGYNALIATPLARADGMIGAIVTGHQDGRPFSDRQAALLKAFADQAVIAIENVRLFKHKSEFLAHMSHELRTPLNAIIGFTRVVMRRSQHQLEAKQYENLEKILASGERLLALINAVLDLSKIDAGRLDVHPGEVSLAALLEQCLRMVEPLVRSEAVVLARDFRDDLPRMVLDEEKLRQIVINLLSNALKFTERGEVRLAARVLDGEVVVEVADTGVGIPAGKLDLIFEEFQQADATRSRGHGGTGLGLTIARRLARLMGGDIEVESAPGAGSTFRVSLPLRYAETERALG
jgi:signal transduction histidine kinase